MYKFLILAAVAACAQAGYVAPYAAAYAAPAVYGGIASTAIGHSSQSTLRSADGSSAISQYSKAVDTAFSSVRKTDTRITNDARYLAYAAPAVAHAPVAYAAPAPVAYAAPAVAKVAAPLAYAAPAYATHAYAAPAYATYAAPAVAKVAAPVAYAAAPVAKAGLVGVAYSAAPAVAHLTYDSPIVHYGF